jgi:hypothetical protein
MVVVLRWWIAVRIVNLTVEYRKYNVRSQVWAMRTFTMCQLDRRLLATNAVADEWSPQPSPGNAYNVVSDMCDDALRCVYIRI